MAKRQLFEFLMGISIFFTTINLSMEHHTPDHIIKRVNVTVYYEAICRDSIAFFTNQLYPSLQTNLSAYMHLELVPYGKSQTKKDGDQYEFICHHGPGECVGNRLHVCAIKQIEKNNPTNDLGYNRITIDFINCLLKMVKPQGINTTYPTIECATETNVRNLNDITNCANHPEGSELLAKSGDITAKLMPTLTSVPTVVFQNHYNKDDTEMAMKNFVGTFCKYLDPNDKPFECNVGIIWKNNIILITLLIIIKFNF